MRPATRGIRPEEPRVISIFAISPEEATQ
jgi:hypothetical protein